MSKKQREDRGIPTGRKKYPKLIVLIGVLFVVLGLATLYISSLFHNRAADLVRPLGKGLVSKGATEECGVGDPGRGPDNTAAHYRAYYDLQMDQNATIALVNKVTKDSGYNLTHASPSNRGPLGAVADVYLAKWYFDETSKQNPYGDIQPGPVRLAVVVDGPGSSNGCKSSKVTQNGHTMVGIEVRLPDYK